MAPSVPGEGLEGTSGLPSAWQEEKVINEMFSEECVAEMGLGPGGGRGGDSAAGDYSALQDGWANTMGLFLAQRENTVFSVMKRWALRGARSCARYI